MKLTEVEKILKESSQKDWIVDDETGSFTYKEDLNLRIERADYDTYSDFNEEWATSHPDKSAKKVDYTVKYGQSFVDRKNLVSVDGHRATLPMTESAISKNVSSEDVNFAKIIDTSSNVDEYIKRSGLTIK